MSYQPADPVMLQRVQRIGFRGIDLNYFILFMENGESVTG